MRDGMEERRKRNHAVTHVRDPRFPKELRTEIVEDKPERRVRTRRTQWFPWQHGITTLSEERMRRAQRIARDWLYASPDTYQCAEESRIATPLGQLGRKESRTVSTVRW